MGTEVWINEKKAKGEEEMAKHLLGEFRVCYRVLMNGEKSEENIEPVKIRITSITSWLEVRTTCTYGKVLVHAALLQNHQILHRVPGLSGVSQVGEPSGQKRLVS